MGYDELYNKEKDDTERRIRNAREYYYERLSKEKRGLAIGVVMLLFGVLMGYAYFVVEEKDGNGGVLLMSIVLSILGGTITYQQLSFVRATKQQILDISINLAEAERNILKEKKELANQQRLQEELRQEQDKYDHPECPVCSSRNTRRITTLNRAVSISFVGLASSKIGKQYECLKCKHKW